MSVELQRSEVSSKRTTSASKAALIMLGIRPFTKGAVGKYKQERLEYATKVWQDMIIRNQRTSRYLYFSIVGLVALPMIVLALGGALMLFNPGFILPLGLLALGETGFVVWSIRKKFEACLRLYVKTSSNTSLMKAYAPKWFRTPYSKYVAGELYPAREYPLYYRDRVQDKTTLIPQKAQEIQKEISKLAPSVSFYIDHLGLCPFLVAVDSDGVDEYLEVWKEREFQETREA